MVRAIAMLMPRYRLLVLLGMLYSMPAFSELLLVPQEIEFKDIAQSQEVLVMRDGQPLPREDILGIVCGVRKTGDEVFARDGRKEHFSDYSYMFGFTTNDDGSITMRPDRDLVQIGSYELHVRTVHGTATGRIEASLEDTNPTRPEYRNHMPRITYAPAQTSFLYGQAISIELGADESNTYNWYIDGESHSSGPGLTSFRAWPEPGEHEISVMARNPAGAIVSRWSDTFKVVNEEPLLTSVRKGQKVQFKAPSGYARVTWYYDGKQISDNRLERSARDVQSVSFKKRGVHTLSCKAQDSVNGNFRLISWSITVN